MSSRSTNCACAICRRNSMKNGMRYGECCWDRVFTIDMPTLDKRTEFKQHSASANENIVNLYDLAVGLAKLDKIEHQNK